MNTEENRPAPEATDCGSGTTGADSPRSDTGADVGRDARDQAGSERSGGAHGEGTAGGAGADSRSGRTYADPRFIAELARRLASRLPDGVQAVRSDLQKNFEAMLSSALGRLDLVTREEFDVQRRVLQRTREKLERLETALDALEARAGNDTGTDARDTAADAPGVRIEPGQDEA